MLIKIWAHTTSTFIRLSHLHQEFYVHCIVILNDGEDGIVGGG